MTTGINGQPRQYGDYDPTRYVTLSDKVSKSELTWTELAPSRWRNRGARKLTGEPGLLDEAYRAARAIACGGFGHVFVVVEPDGKLNSGSSEGKRYHGLVTLSISGADRDEMRRWAERRLGARGWRTGGDGIEEATLT